MCLRLLLTEARRLCSALPLFQASLNEAACELEIPFGLGANHLQLMAYQRSFNSKLARLLDRTLPMIYYTPEDGAVARLSGSRLSVASDVSF